MYLSFVSIAWIIGTFLGSLLHIPFFFIFAGLIPLPVIIIKRRYLKIAILSSICFLALTGGMLRYAVSVPATGEENISYYTGSRLTMRGMIATDVEKTGKSIIFALKADTLVFHGTTSSVDGLVQVLLLYDADIKYGDYLELTGYLEEPEQSDSFNYKDYLVSQGIFSLMRYPKIRTISRDHGNVVMGSIYSFRHLLANILEEILPEPQASLAQGILLGLRGNIPAEIKNEFAASGTTHILAISGQNLSIVAGILISLGIWLLGRKHYIYVWLTLATLLAYTVMTGLSPPVIRSAIMAGVFLLAEFFGRQKSAGTALMFAAAVMIGINPLTLWNASFQMSFMAMVGLIVITPPLQKRSREMVIDTYGETSLKSRIINTVLDSTIVTLAATLAVWPITAYYFHITSFVAPLSTLLALPAMPGIIVAGSLAATLGIILPPLGTFAGWFAWLFLSYLLFVVKGSATVPYGFTHLKEFPPEYILYYYLVMLFIVLLIKFRHSLANVFRALSVKCIIFCKSIPLKWLAIFLSLCAILMVITAFTLPDTRTHVVFLNVGQGDAIFIKRSSQQILIDGGPDNRSILTELGKQLPFWDRTIELVVLTHPDSDHLTGLIEVLKKYRINNVIMPGTSNQTELFQKWLDILNKKRIHVILAEESMKINMGDSTSGEIINPSRPLEFEPSSDDNSVVINFHAGDINFLLTGDISTQGEYFLLSRMYELSSTVLKVAHHGSRYSSSPEFLNAVSPDIAVISVGKHNRFGHPNQETLERLQALPELQKIFRTDCYGTVEFITDGQRLWVKTEHSP